MASTDPFAADDAFTRAIHDSVDQAVAAIPPGKTNALIVDGTYSQGDGAGFHAVWLHKVNDNFEVAASGAYDGPRGVSGKVEGVYSW